MARSLPRLRQKTYLTGPLWVVPAVAGILVLLLPLYVGDQGVLRTVVSTALLSMLVLGINIPFGYAGEFALGQSALYGVGAYFAGYFAIHSLDVPLTIIIGILAAAAVGLLTGFPGIRLGSWALGMVTFFLVLLLPNVILLLPTQTGGAGGLAGIPLASVFGTTLDANGYYFLVIAIAILFFVLLRNYLRSRHGAALKVMRESPTLAVSLGYSLRGLKLSAYVIGALPAGAAGALFAYQDGYISPGSFGFQMATAILAASIIGGSESIYGAIIGSAILTVGPLQISAFQQYSLILYGLILVVGGLFFRGGIAGLLRRLIRRYFVDDSLLPDVEGTVRSPQTIGELPGQLLVVEDVVKDFGGNKALKGVSLEARPGDVTALIGPNGSGKTTLLNIICGFYAATSGTVRVGSERIDGRRPYRIARLGVSRTFQTPLVPKSMTAAEVVGSAGFARHRTSALSAMLTLPGSRRAARRDRAEALRLLSMMGIAELADRPASDLPLGTRRILEVARALEGSPSLVLLDEPASGLDEAEVTALGEVIKRLSRAGATVVIVEHNFEMIMSIADVVNVLHLGRIIVSGPPESVRRDPEVVESYLGKEARAQLEREIQGGRA